MDKRECINRLTDALRGLALGELEVDDVVGMFSSAGQQALPGIEPAPPKKQAVTRVLCLELFQYWARTCQREKARPTDERLRAIRARLQEGYSAVEIRAAIDGAAVGAFVNEQGKRYDDITLICRNGAKLEDFIGRGGTSIEELSEARRVPESQHKARIAELTAIVERARNRGVYGAEYERANQALRRAVQASGAAGT